MPIMANLSKPTADVGEMVTYPRDTDPPVPGIYYREWRVSGWVQCTPAGWFRPAVYTRCNREDATHLQLSGFTTLVVPAGRVHRKGHYIDWCPKSLVAVRKSALARVGETA